MSISCKSVHIDAGLGRMAVRVYGESHRKEATPVLLVHGFPLDSSMWSEQIDALAVDRMLIVPDLPGCGASDPVAECVSMAEAANELATVVEQLVPGSPIAFCGLSMGGYIGWELWNQHSELIASLVMCDTRAANDSPTVAKGRTMTAAKFNSDGAAVESPVSMALELKNLANTMVGKLFAGATLQQNSDVVEATRQVIQSSRPAAVAAYLRGMAARADFTDRLPEIDVPVLLLCGEHDSITPSDEMNQLSDTIPNSTFVEIEAAGHMAPLEQPVQANQAIRAFLTS